MTDLARFVLGLALSAAFSLDAIAADVITVGEAASFNWSALPIEVGRDQGIWRKYGFDEVKPVGFAGDAKLQQVLTAGDVDFGLGGGPGMAFFAKGVPAKAIAVESSAPRTLSIMAVNDSSVRSAADLKGRKIGVSTAGSLSWWLARRFAVARGWGPDGVLPIALGSLDANMAALKTHQVDAILTATAVGFQLEERNEAKTS
jgi:ABC-type nitrate/sulfonate/bicarbonate transport system substrate-binding protein